MAAFPVNGYKTFCPLENIINILPPPLRRLSITKINYFLFVHGVFIWQTVSFLFQPDVSLKNPCPASLGGPRKGTLPTVPSRQRPRSPPSMARGPFGTPREHGSPGPGACRPPPSPPRGSTSPPRAHRRVPPDPLVARLQAVARRRPRHQRHRRAVLLEHEAHHVPRPMGLAHVVVFAILQTPVVGSRAPRDQNARARREIARFRHTNTSSCFC